ncbi:SGNH/GDSL hydrolase family protein [Candidatus Roizmanbacteria bacterium]|nr:SGNH/GDSL hydrolase family protein [Candidatus Roizmanbacteria bacterium]
MSDRPPFSRREFLNYSWLASLGFVFALIACNIPSWLLPKKEKEPLPKSFILFASSMGLDIGRRLNREPLLDMSQNQTTEMLWNLQDSNNKTSVYIHSKAGARIPDVIKWIEHDSIPDNNANDIFIIIGGNEIASEIPKDKLSGEAEKIIDLAIAVNKRFIGKKVHFVLPPQTLLDKDDPRFEYEVRRQIFNSAIILNLKRASEERRIIDIEEPIKLDDLVSGPSIFRDARHFKEDIIDAIIYRINEQIK